MCPEIREDRKFKDVKVGQKFHDGPGTEKMKITGYTRHKNENAMTYVAWQGELAGHVGYLDPEIIVSVRV